MRFGILGPIDVRADDGELVPVGGPRPRSLLALLTRSARARVLTALGRIAEADGDPAEALRRHHEAIAVAADNHNSAALADTIAGLAGALARSYAELSAVAS